MAQITITGPKGTLTNEATLHELEFGILAVLRSRTTGWWSTIAMVPELSRGIDVGNDQRWIILTTMDEVWGAYKKLADPPLNWVKLDGHGKRACITDAGIEAFDHPVHIPG